MKQAIAAACSYLEERYQSLLGDAFQGFCTDLQEDTLVPTWIPLNAQLRPDSADTIGQEGAALLDREVGICLIFLTFTRGNELEQQVSRALELRVRLQPGAADATICDSHGTWQVVVHWLLRHGDLADWQQRIAHLRATTSFFEDVPVDVVVNRGEPWRDSLAGHRLPRLLLTTRAVLRMKQPDQPVRWASADDQVRRRISELSERLSSGVERTLARELTQYAAD